MIQVIQGDCLQVIRRFDKDTFGGVVTDPPYSSGGQSSNARQQPTGKKYGIVNHNDFEGDGKDQRSWTNWMAEWMYEARRVCKKGAPIVVFSDWRQLPSLTDAMQWAGWIWRGILPWDKTNARPQKGRYRQQCEFVAWGSNGAMPITRNVPILPGIYQYPIPTASNRMHQTQKPVELMRALVRIVEPGECILEPFAGSGSTLVAAELEGYSAIGIEIMSSNVRIIEERLKQVSFSNGEYRQRPVSETL
ncbi:MAG: DNA-methyltransferase [Burkholderiales bacterium]